MDDPTKPVAIEIRVEGKTYAEKYWHHIPRKGDRIILANRKVAEVSAIYWSDAGRDSIIYDCWVQLVCEIVGEVDA